MANPGGNYPGRQPWVGLLGDLPAFAYFGSGRSPQSQQRYAAPFDERESAIRIKPVNPNEEFDPFRHYQAVRIDPETGIVVISNSQAPQDPLVETYKFDGHEGETAEIRAEKILAAIGPEYDNKKKPTSRVIGIIDPRKNPVKLVIGITTKLDYAVLRRIDPFYINKVFLVQTYDGQVEYANFDPRCLDDYQYSLAFPTLVTTAQQLAHEIYEMSNYVDPKYGELRVWCVAGVRNGKGPGGWEIARRNRHQVE